MNIRQFSERTKTLIELGGGIGVSILVLILFWLGAFTVPELLTYDWRFMFRGERPPLQDIVLVTIDEESEHHLQQRTPWKRSLHAKLVNILRQYEPTLIIYDLIFQSATEIQEDEAFSNALYDAYDEGREMGIVVLAQYISPQRLERPLAVFADNAGGIGVINLYPDRDNIVRSLPIVTQTFDNDAIHYDLSLSLEAAALYKGGVNHIEFPDDTTTVLSRVQEGTTREILRVAAPEGKLYINYIGGRYSYPMISFWEIIQGAFQPEDIRHKVIFIGDTSLTSHDYFLTPFRTPNRRFVKSIEQETLEGSTLTNISIFGIEIHAQAFQTILEQSAIRKLPRHWSAMLILAVGILSGLLFFHGRQAGVNILLLFLVGGGIWGVSQYLFSTHYLWIDLAPLEIAMMTNFVVGLAFQRAVALYNRNKVKGAFQQYVSTAVVEEVLRNPAKLHLGGERKTLTVLFSDIRGFTSISEGMESQVLVEFLNEYLTEMTDIVLQYDGTLDKYMGDAIMAIYGAPIWQPDHPARACASALDMIARLHELQPQWLERGKPSINIGIGINSGTMTVGNMGSEKRFDYTVMGDNVNLGSRLEGTNKLYGTNIIISEFTYQDIKDDFITRELDLVRVKGKLEPVKIYELLGRVGELVENRLTGITTFEAGLAEYRRKRWLQATELFQQALGLSGIDPPSTLYIERCRTYQAAPPPESWDGVYTMKTK